MPHDGVCGTCSVNNHAPRTTPHLPMTRVLLVPDLPLERWPSMDRYAHRLHDWLESTDPGFEVRLAASIGALTPDRAGGRGPGSYPRWWAPDGEPPNGVVPGAVLGPPRHLARHF